MLKSYENIILSPNVKKKLEKKHFEIGLLMSHFVPHYCEPGLYEKCPSVPLIR